MNTRIRQIRKDHGLSQEEFAQNVNLTKNYISLIENGNRTLADRTIKDICRIYNVNEEWLRTGNGSPYIAMTKNQQIIEFANEVLQTNDAVFKKRLVYALSVMGESGWDALENFINQINQKD